VPGQQEVRWSQLKVGALVIIALVALVALVFLMSGSGGGFWTGHITIVSYFENSAGLKVGAPVNLEGVAVGSVEAIHIVPSRGLTPVEVLMRVSADRAKDIHTDSKSSLETVGVLGDTVVDIDSRRAVGPPVQNGAVISTTETPNLQDVIQASQGTIEKLNTILDKVNTIVGSLNSDKGSIGMLINDKSLYNKAVSTLNQLSALVNDVSSGKGSIGKLVKDDTLYNNLTKATKGLNQIVTSVNSGHGTLGKLMTDDQLYNNFNQSAKNLNEILARINAGQGSIGMLAKDPKFQAKLSDTVSQMDTLLQNINSGQGTVGQLMKNRDLYDHADQVMLETKGLMTEIRKNPKKYLTIRMRIF
jgi:phospholipid/cholesterol/gamma-HCH transport system substrate-binding protein